MQSLDVPISFRKISILKFNFRFPSLSLSFSSLEGGPDASLCWISLKKKKKKKKKVEKQNLSSQQLLFVKY